MRQLLDAGEAVLGGVEARLEQPQRERRQRRHLAAPAHGLALQLGDGDDGVDEPHLERLLGRVEASEKPDLLRALQPHGAGQEPRPEASVEASDPRARLAEARVVPGDAEVAHEVQDVTPADRVAGDHRHHRLGKTADCDVEVADVEPPHASLGDGVVADVPVIAPDALVAAGAERVGSGAREDDRRDLEVVACELEGSRSSRSVWGRNALRLSGRSIVIFAIVSAFS